MVILSGLKQRNHEPATPHRSHARKFVYPERALSPVPDSIPVVTCSIILGMETRYLFLSQLSKRRIQKPATPGQSCVWNIVYRRRVPSLVSNSVAVGNLEHYIDVLIPLYSGW